MKRRFQVTLLVVAIAVAGSTAFAMAPVIGTVRSPVIADDTPTTDDNVFVYPDALDADTLADDPDDTVTPDAIIWTYFSSGSVYQINGQDSLDIGNPSNDPNNPTAAQDLSQGDDPDADDSNMRTWTFRDAGYSAIGGAPYADPNPGNSTTEVIRTGVVTLFASDGSSWSMKNVMVYTESNGRDRLSGDQGEIVLDQEPSVALGWTSSIIFDNGISLADNNGLCITSPPGEADQFALWTSPYGIVELVQSSVYRFRITLDSNGTALPAGQTPFWDFLIDNFNNAQTANNKYAADFMNWDNEGGANSVGLSTTTGRGIFDVFFTPPPVTADDWNDPTTGQFIASNDGNIDMRFSYRVIDAGPAVDDVNDFGTVCLRNIEVTRFDVDSLAPVGAALYEESNITASTHIGGFIVANSTTITFAGGSVTIAPNTTGPLGTNAWDNEIATLDPGNGIVFTTPAENIDNWPVKWEADTLLKATMSVQAPSAEAEANPIDAISLTWDTPTNEMLLRSEVYAATNNNGMPKLAAPTDYLSYFYTNNLTASPSAGAGEFDRIRMRVLLLLTVNINSGGSADNVGGVVIHSQKIEEVSVP
jgi:hypothetical protein